jgi:hypothetical protein
MRSVVGCRFLREALGVRFYLLACTYMHRVRLLHMIKDAVTTANPVLMHASVLRMLGGCLIDVHCLLHLCISGRAKKWDVK